MKAILCVPGGVEVAELIRLVGDGLTAAPRLRLRCASAHRVTWFAFSPEPWA